MTYEELIDTISEIINNPKIFKTGLHLTYELPEKTHRQMNEHLFYKSNPINTYLPLNDVFEVQIDGLIIKFIKQNAQ